MDVVIDFIAGSMGATASVYVGQPLDTLKVKMQTFPTLYPNLRICFKETWRKDGLFRGLYAGSVPSLAANVAENSVLFAAYGICQKMVAKSLGVPKVEDLTTTANGLSGFLAAFWSSLFLCPTELVKCRMQAMRETSGNNTGKKPMGPLQITGQILKSDGISGLFCGLVPTLVREMPGYFCFFFAYELTRDFLRQPGKSKDEIGAWRTIVSGGVAGVTLWTIVFPADVLKSRIQVSGLSERMLPFAMKIIRKEGFLALYNGLFATVLRTFPATGALFFAYEYSKSFMRKYQDIIVS